MTENDSFRVPFWVKGLDIIGYVLLGFLIVLLLNTSHGTNKSKLITQIMLIFAFFLMTLVKYNPAMANGIVTDEKGEASSEDKYFVSTLMIILKTFIMLLAIGMNYLDLN